VAVKWFTRAAEAGHANAQNNLGVCYAYGTGVARDFAAARTWLLRAAAAGDAQAPSALAKLDALEAAQ
jgi:TPR repeat protein